MKISKMFAVLAVSITALSICGLKANETNSIIRPANEVPGYSFNFMNVDSQKVLDVYTNLTGVQLEFKRPVPYAAINFRTAKSLTRAEAVQAFEKVMREQAGIVLKHLDAKHVEVTFDESVKVKN